MSSSPHAPSSYQPTESEDQFSPSPDVAETGEEQWLEPASLPEIPGAGGRAVLGWALGVLALLWLGFVAWTAGRSLADLPLDSTALIQWIALAAGPLALLGLCWLMFGRTRRREADAFTRSVIAMRSEARALEGLLAVLRQRIDEEQTALRDMASQLMGLGDEATARLKATTAEFDEGAQRLAGHGEALDRAAQAARVDLGVLLTDLPVAETSARAIAETLALAGRTAGDNAARLDEQVGRLASSARQADVSIDQAAARLALHLRTIDERSEAALGRLEQVAGASHSTVDSLLQRTAEALDEIRSGIAIQSDAVVALVDQASAAIGRAGSDSAAALRGHVEQSSALVEQLGARLAAEEEATGQLLARLDSGLSSLDQRFAAFAEDGDERAAVISQSFERLRNELALLDEQSTASGSTADSLAERMTALRQSVDALAGDVAGQLGPALEEAEGAAQRLRGAAGEAQPTIVAARDAAAETHRLLGESASAVESQHDRLAELLAAVDTGVGGAQRRLGELVAAIGEAEGSASHLTAETGPALVAALVQVKEAAAHAAERAAEAIERVIPASAGNLSDAARAALEQAVRDTVTTQLAEIERAAGEAVGAARTASDRLMQQMLSIGQSAAALEAHLAHTEEAQRERDSETFARRVSLLIDSMHSASIDVGKILSDEVDDKAWAAYLKGNRGIFTRRAVRLLGNHESRALSAHYESDREFHDSVNRYVHDFEAMLRRVTADRDGGPMAVTLMSSDMGKLYAALAEVVGSRR